MALVAPIAAVVPKAVAAVPVLPIVIAAIAAVVGMAAVMITVILPVPVAARKCPHQVAAVHLPEAVVAVVAVEVVVTAVPPALRKKEAVPDDNTYSFDLFLIESIRFRAWPVTLMSGRILSASASLINPFFASLPAINR